MFSPAKMDSIEISPLLDNNDKYDKRCGELFLTIQGNIIFHCTLCEERFKGFTEYVEHVKDVHYEIPSNLSHENDPLQAEDATETNDYDLHFEEKDEIDINFIIERDDSSIGGDFADVHEPEIKVPRTTSQRKGAIPPEKKHKCKICGLAFAQTSNLYSHVRRHFNEKRYNCTECPKAFHTRTELDTHVRRHKGERPFICEECGQCFVTSGVLTMHARRHKDIRNHVCPHCDKKFFDNHALKLHMVGHTNDRPYKCDICGTAFSRKKSVEVHKKIHENKREYQCEYCDASFNQKSGLYSHVKLKHCKSNTGEI